MANIKISELPELTTPADVDEIAIVDNDVAATKKVTRGNLFPDATSSLKGLATAAQITKLDGIAAGAQPGTVTSVTGTAPVASSGGTTPAISIPAATNLVAGHATAAHITAIEANTAKNTNVPTALSMGTIGVATIAITSDGGADDVTLPTATNAAAGVASAAQITKLDGIEASADVTDNINVNAAGATMNADTDVSANGWVIDEDNMASNLASKVPTQQSVKAYVDAVASGLDLKDSSRVATAAALPACTPAGSGIGKTLTATAVGILTVDGVATVLNNRILVKNQVAGADNGIYKVTTEGTAGVAFVLTRATDFDQDAEVTSGAFTFAEEGTVGENNGYALTTNDPITVDTTALVFSQFSGAGQIIAGTGMTKTGNTLDVGGGTGLTANADDLSVDYGSTAGTACQGNDVRLSDARTPTAHAGSHITGGSDIVANAIAAGNAGLMSGADKTKLDGIAAGAQPGTVTSVTGTAPVASSGGTTPAISIPAATNLVAGHATAAHITAIEANTAKNTNVPTALSMGTIGVATIAITSDGGADDVTLPTATNAAAGVASAAQITKLDGIEAGADVTDSTNVNATVKRIVVIKCIADDTALTVADGKAYFTVPIELNGMNLISVGAHVYTVSSSGLPTFQIHNLTDAQDMLSTALTIDATEKDSKDATTPAVINTTYDDVATGDELRFDCDVAGTSTKGWEIRMGFQLV